MENGDGILDLCKYEAIPMFLKFNTKKSRSWAKIFESEMIFEKGDKMMYLREGWSNDENAIHIDENVERSCKSVI